MTNETDNIRQAVVERFASLAASPEEEQMFPVGRESAKQLGYDAARIDALPTSATESFCGVGNPLSLGRMTHGDTIIDLGSGAGMDSLIAASLVGPTGKVIGVDMTPAMIHKARQNADVLRISNVEFRLGTLEELPIDDNSIDVAITNGVLNLCPDKPAVLQEVHRVLRPGGRLQMADILLHDEVTPEEVAKRGTWSD